MSGSPLRRLLTVAASTVVLGVAVAPSPALASSMFFAKSSGTFAATSWVEIGELPAATGALGNAHFGDLWVEDLGNGRNAAFGSVYDVQCDDGVTPYLPMGGHGAPPDPNAGCELVGTRFIQGGTTTFTIDRRFNTARLTGTLAVGSGHGEGPVGAPPVDITWTGVGDTYTTRDSGSGTDEYGSYRYSYTFTGRDADIAGGSRIGPMIFDDEGGEYSDARLGKYRNSDRSRS